MSKIFEDFVAISRYCRWVPDLGRRETWDEAVDRYINYLTERFELDVYVLDEARAAMKNREVFGSMRALMTAGPALDKDDVAAYNCSYIAVDRPSAFRNIMYILMCGTGVGFSCESDNTDKLPEIPAEITKTKDVVVVEDSREGWADAYHKFIHSLYSGYHPTVVTYKLRQAGSRLKTFGGRSSGPEPLERLIRATANMFYSARGRKLKTIEVHDLVCQIAEIVICGGVRRSALISLSDLHDREMSLAKTGPWWEIAGHRSLSNNSAIYEKKPELGEFMQEWSSLYDSKSGERGICNREAMTTRATLAGRRTEGIKFGTNPCSEIILRDKQFCNLSTVVAKSTDTEADLYRKVAIAALLGTLQSALTNFTFFEERGDFTFRENCSEERLLGVSITGIMDCPLINGKENNSNAILNKMKDISHEINREWAVQLGINPSASVTCVKPEGTTSCVAGSSSGMHPRYAAYYIRRVRLDAKDPIVNLMQDAGVPNEPCVMNPDHTIVFSFPMKAPEESLISSELTAIEHLDLWKKFQLEFCDHKPSITVSYKDIEFLNVGGWVWKEWDLISGISFLPDSDHIYQQAPFEEITEEQYQEMASSMPKHVDWETLSKYEKEDETKHAQTLSCTAGGCEII